MEPRTWRNAGEQSSCRVTANVSCVCRTSCKIWQWKPHQVAFHTVWQTLCPVFSLTSSAVGFFPDKGELRGAVINSRPGLRLETVFPLNQTQLRDNVGVERRRTSDFTAIPQAAGNQPQVSKHLSGWTDLQAGKQSFKSEFFTCKYVQCIYVCVCVCLYPHKMQLKFPNEHKKKSVCVGADESVHRFGGFVCFDLVSSVKVNIILNTWQAGRLSRRFPVVDFSALWATNGFTLCTVNTLGELAPVHFATTWWRPPSAPSENERPDESGLCAWRNNQIITVYQLIPLDKRNPAHEHLAFCLQWETRRSTHLLPGEKRLLLKSRVLRDLLTLLIWALSPSVLGFPSLGSCCISRYSTVWVWKKQQLASWILLQASDRWRRMHRTDQDYQHPCVKWESVNAMIALAWKKHDIIL